MKTAEEILKKHISKMIGRSEDLFHSIDDMKKLPEWKSLLEAMEEYANQSKPLPSDEEIEKQAKIVRDKTLHGNVPITEEQLQLGEWAYINGAKWMRDNYLSK